MTIPPLMPSMTLLKKKTDGGYIEKVVDDGVNPHGERGASG